MNKTIRLLSTKNLTPLQKNIFSKSNIYIDQHNFIENHPIDITPNNYIRNAIFSSKNAVLSIKKYDISITNVFCVGQKTSSYFQNVAEVCNNSEELAKTIVQKYQNEEFVFFCGNLRRKELPDILSKNGVIFEETIVYNTALTPKKMSTPYDGILFFSPSAVSSFVKINKLGNATAFCIGGTTANKAKQYTDNVKTSSEQNIESILVDTKKHFSLWH